MPAALAFFIVAVAVIAITYKTYVGYGDYHWALKTSFLLFLILGWSAPVIGFALRRNYPSEMLIYSTKGMYFLFGFVFFLFIITILRDTIWVLVDVIRRASVEDMKNPRILQIVNIITFISCLLFCFYGVYEAEKQAAIKTYDITSPKVTKITKIVMLSDLHIDVDVPVKYVKNVVSRVNDLHPDAIVLVGDIIDNTPENLQTQMEELKNLKAKDGVYIVHGNHEFYSNALNWEKRFRSMGFLLLNNEGKSLNETGVYIAGIPDINAGQTLVIASRALAGARNEDYVILLSHTPKVAEGITSENTDLILSGHTHGGQIFPFHYFAMQANQGKLAGFYNDKGIKMYISRGTRYWGPPMRIFAPSEITIFNIKPQNNV